LRIHKDDTDQELLALYRKKGNSSYLGELFSRYTDLVYGLCLKYLKDRELAQDAVMNIFEKLIEKLKTEEVEYFKSWLYMVAKNHCLMELRKKSPETSSDFMELTIVAHPIDDSLDVESELDALEKCFETLKKEQEQCVKLFYLQKMSYQQVSEATRFDQKAVKSFIQNGKRNLKICLEENNVSR
jgi:RNA polymerase sigma-70 factor (ECF subfamily)